MSPDEIKTLLDADRAPIVQAWLETMGRAPPARLSLPMMSKLLAVERQWEASGQSQKAYVRKLRRIIEAAEQAAPVADAGKRLVREWNGRTHIVDITPDGYVWRGRTWASLSAIAKEITGTKWSGPRFFGVRT